MKTEELRDLLRDALDILARVSIPAQGGFRYGADLRASKTGWILEGAFDGSTAKPLDVMERFKLMQALPLLRALRYAQVIPVPNYGVYALTITDEGIARREELKRAA